VGRGAVNVDYVMLAEDATAAEGRLYIHGGGLRHVVVSQIPWVIHLALVARLYAELDELGDSHSLGMRIWEPDGQPIYPLQTTVFTLNREHLAAEDDNELQVLVSLRVSAIVLREAGWYHAELALDGDVVRSMPFHISVRR
jgi:hypothetical protein